jgi:hypothetical protein
MAETNRANQIGDFDIFSQSDILEPLYHRLVTKWFITKFCATRRDRLDDSENYTIQDQRTAGHKTYE